MKYFYISCLLLSSLFTYKTSFASAQEQKYAIFIPNNAFQQNVEFEEQDNWPRRRYQIEDEEETEEDIEEQEYNSALELVDDFAEYEETPAQTVKDENNPIPSAIAPKEDITEEPAITPKAPKPSEEPFPRSLSQEPTTQTKPTPLPTDISIPEEIKEKLKKYNLEENIDNFPVKPQTSSPKRTISLQNILKNNVEDMFKMFPPINKTEPRFKQTYAKYGSDLYILYKRGSLPENRKQEEILNKANSSRRFEVK